MEFRGTRQGLGDKDPGYKSLVTGTGTPVKNRMSP
jgi:hypothetical protein